MGTRNRRAGHAWELEMAKIFKDLGFSHVVSSRSESRSRDNQKVDLINHNEGENGRFVFNVQAKTTTGHLKYSKLLHELPTIDGVINVLAHRQTAKSNTRFLVTGKYVAMSLDDFCKMVKLLNKTTLLTPEIVKNA